MMGEGAKEQRINNYYSETLQRLYKAQTSYKAKHRTDTGSQQVALELRSEAREIDEYRALD